MSETSYRQQLLVIDLVERMQNYQKIFIISNVKCIFRGCVRELALAPEYLNREVIGIAAYGAQDDPVIIVIK